MRGNVKKMATSAVLTRWLKLSSNTESSNVLQYQPLPLTRYVIIYEPFCSSLTSTKLPEVR